MGDLNGDGRPDLIVGGRESGGLVWYENPSWTRHAISADGAFSTDQETGDVDGDGRNDVISLTYDGLVWFSGSDWRRNDIATAHLHDIEVADLDGDGRLDIVGRGQTAFGSTPPGIELYFQRDSGWETRQLPAPSGEGLKVSDIDDDGSPDVVISGVWYRNPGARGGEWVPYDFAAEWDWPDAYVATGDINGDGRLDIVLSPAEKPGMRYRLSWFEAPPDRTGTWTEHLVLPGVEAVHHFVGVADFNQDGRADIATAAMHQGQPPTEVAVYLQSPDADELVQAGALHARLAQHAGVRRRRRRGPGSLRRQLGRRAPAGGTLDQPAMHPRARVRRLSLRHARTLTS